MPKTIEKSEYNNIMNQYGCDSNQFGYKSNDRKDDDVRMQKGNQSEPKIKSNHTCKDNLNYGSTCSKNTNHEVLSCSKFIKSKMNDSIKDMKSSVVKNNHERNSTSGILNKFN